MGNGDPWGLPEWEVRRKPAGSRAGKMVAARTCRILLGHGAGKHRFLGDFDSSRMFPQLPGPFDVLSPQTYGGPDTGRLQPRP